MNKVMTSKYLSYILRHNPSAAGITLDSGGWGDVNALLEGVNKTRSLTFEQLENIVATDGKNRFSFNADKSKIRANQGHSICVDLNLQPVTPPDILYHGTAERFAKNIAAWGILPMSRQYVHLSDSIESAESVGKRHGEPIVYSIDCKKMTADGFLFYLSENGVWLTKAVPAEYLKL